jgi:hypothetical protein
MCNDNDDDCVFMETGRDVRQQAHMYVECVPLPRDVGDTAPIYFKVCLVCVF